MIKVVSDSCRWFSQVSFTNKTDRHDITEIFLKVVLNTINPIQNDSSPCIYLRNESWKPECVESFNMGWRILVFYPELEAKDKIY